MKALFYPFVVSFVLALKKKTIAKAEIIIINLRMGATLNFLIHFKSLHASRKETRFSTAETKYYCNKPLGILHKEIIHFSSSVKK